MHHVFKGLWSPCSAEFSRISVELTSVLTCCLLFAWGQLPTHPLWFYLSGKILVWGDPNVFFSHFICVYITVYMSVDTRVDVYICVYKYLRVCVCVRTCAQSWLMPEIIHRYPSLHLIPWSRVSQWNTKLADVAWLFSKWLNHGAIPRPRGMHYLLPFLACFFDLLFYTFLPWTRPASHGCLLGLLP